MMALFTVQRMAQIYRERLGIGIPHPLAETCHRAKALGIYVPCPNCPFDYTCESCDSKIAEIYNGMVETEAN